ncbi:unnamed protein product [Phytomonas sp. EM1]|nr:unnamed protein product [Phytomonas sp. EM1]|eukprot:CCW61909.1 unnamed protein product [Phytomonas sp. isolate EM1]
MICSLESITEVTKLRRAVLDVELELEAKREEYNQRMAVVRQGEEQVAKDREELQDTLVKYYKFIQENELKRIRANKKVITEEKQRKEREEHMRHLEQHLKELEEKRTKLRQEYNNFSKYQTFLEAVLARNDGDEYQEPRDIMKRWMTLQDNTKVLQLRKTQLEEDLLRSKNTLNVARQKHSSESVSLQNQLNELQMKFKSLHKMIKVKQDELKRKIRQKSTTTRTITHVSMAAKNLCDRCLLWTQPYSGRGKGESHHDGVLHQLRVIGDCLEDFQSVIIRHLQNGIATGGGT